MMAEQYQAVTLTPMLVNTGGSNPSYRTNRLVMEKGYIPVLETGFCEFESHLGDQFCRCSANVT